MDTKRVFGLWDDGYTLDQHTLSSKIVGEDAFGRPVFQTERTKLGQLLYQMKYNGHYDTSDAIIELIFPFVSKWLADKKIDAIIPVPASVNRAVQPVYEIAEKLAISLSIPYAEGIIEKKTDGDSMKNTPAAERTLDGRIFQKTRAIRHCNVLLFDDLYSTGTTANECTKILKKDPLIDCVYFLALTQTK